MLTENGRDDNLLATKEGVMSADKLIDRKDSPVSLKDGDKMVWKYRGNSAMCAYLKREITDHITVIKKDGTIAESFNHTGMTKTIFLRLAMLTASMSNLNYRITEEPESMTCIFFLH